MSDRIEVDREDLECQEVLAYVDDDGEGVVEIHLGVDGMPDYRLAMTPDQATELIGWLRKAVASLLKGAAS